MQLNPFLNSNEVYNLINMCEYFNKCPSDMIGLTDTYTSYCFNEAIAYIKSRLAKGDEPIKKVKENTKKYSSFSALYSKYE